MYDVFFFFFFFYESCDQIQFEVNCMKSHQCVISDGLLDG